MVAMLSLGTENMGIYVKTLISRNFFRKIVLTENAIFVNLKWSFGVIGFKRDNVEDFIESVEGAEDSNVSYNPWSEVKLLPRSTEIFGIVYHSNL